MPFPLDNPFRGSWHGALTSDVSVVDALVQEAFQELLPWGLGVNIDLFGCDPTRICDRDVLRAFVLDLCNQMGVHHSDNLLLTPFDEDRSIPSISLVQVLGKSVIWGHCLGPDAAVCLHLFSCNPYLPYQTAALCQQWFAARDVNVSVAFRGPHKAIFGYLFAE